MRCAYCHDTLEDTVGVCGGCQTGLHSECWSEAQRCPTLGCGRTPFRPLTWLGWLLSSVLIFLGAWVWIVVGGVKPPHVKGYVCFRDLPLDPPSWDPVPSWAEISMLSPGEGIFAPPRPDPVPSWRRGTPPLELEQPPFCPDSPATTPETTLGRIQRGPRRRLAA